MDQMNIEQVGKMKCFKRDLQTRAGEPYTMRIKTMQSTISPVVIAHTSAYGPGYVKNDFK